MSKLTVFVVLITIASFIGVASADDPELPLCLAMKDAATNDLDVEAMRTEYAPAFVFGSDDCAFPNGGEQVAAAQHDFHQEIVRLLAEEKQTTVKGMVFSSVVFFHEDGSMQYYFHNGLQIEEGRQVCEIVRRLASGYRFPLEATRPFYCCNTVRNP
jgi:hypothetical protein